MNEVLLLVLVTRELFSGSRSQGNCFEVNVIREWFSRLRLSMAMAGLVLCEGIFTV